MSWRLALHDKDRWLCSGMKKDQDIAGPQSRYLFRGSILLLKEYFGKNVSMVKIKQERCVFLEMLYIYIYIYIIYILVTYIYILCIHIKIYILFFDNKKWCVFFVRAPGLEAGGHSRGANWADGESDVMMLIKCMVAYIFCCEAWSNYENLQKRFSVDTPKSW